MTERIEHVAKAKELQCAARNIFTENAVKFAPHMAAVILLDDARLEAQLALVEQQRIGNMQTERAALRARADGRSDLAAAGMEAQATILDLQIREGLGLT